MKKLLYLCLALLLAVSATAQRKKVFVAVIGEMQDPVIGEMLADEVEYAFSKSPLYTPLARTNEILAVLNKELSFQRSGEILESNIIAIGKKYGAAYACIIEVKYSPTINSNQIAGKLIDVQTTELVHSARPHRSPLKSDADITKSASLLAEALGDKTDKEKNEEARQQQLAYEQAQAAQAAAEQREREKREAEERRKEQMRAYGYTEFVLGNLFVQLKPSTSDVMWDRAKEICGKRGSGWRLPTVRELSLLYNNRDKIFDNSDFFNSINIAVWSNDACTTKKGKSGHLAVGKDNQKICVETKARCLCVRNIK